MWWGRRRRLTGRSQGRCSIRLSRILDTGFITLGLYLTPSMSARAVTLVLLSALAVIAPTDVVRLRVPAVERVYERLLGFLMRESERYILGVNFALTFYPIDVAIVAIL
ncbi:hypothetical protein B0H13DRAFT_2171990, partial [Mycena leptocephala]